MAFGAHFPSFQQETHKLSAKDREGPFSGRNSRQKPWNLHGFVAGLPRRQIGVSAGSWPRRQDSSCGIPKGASFRAALTRRKPSLATDSMPSTHPREGITRMLPASVFHVMGVLISCVSLIRQRCLLRSGLWACGPDS